MLSLGFDPLSSIVAAVDEGDLLPLALTCTTLRDVCKLRSDQTRDPNGPRWYTHGTSRLTWAVKVMKATPNEKWCSYAAKHGNLDFLQWLRQNGCLWDSCTCAYAAKGGHLDILQWVRQNGCPWNRTTCFYAAKEGHLHILQWARQNGCLWDKEQCFFIARNDETRDWIQSQPYYVVV